MKPNDTKPNPTGLEKTLTTKFINYRENTMSSPISNNATLFFISILEDQFEEFSKIYKTGDIDPYNKDLINKIETLYEKSKFELIQYVKTQQEGCIHSFGTEIETLLKAFNTYANQAISTLDQVTLPKLGNEYDGKKTLPLKLIFSAVWRGTIDDDKFTIHDEGGKYDEGSNEKKIEQARKDKRDRVLTLLNRLNEIKEEGVCHHGIRHKLIFSLNGLYKNRFIIEDVNLFIMHQLREHVLDQSYTQYKNKARPPEFLESLLEWITSSDAKALLAQIDPNEEIIKTIKNKLNKSGIKETRLYENKDIIISNLPFSCDPKQHPEFYAIHRLMCLSISPNRKPAYAALEKIKCIMIDEFTLDKDKNISEKINFIIDIFNLYKELHALEVLFSIDGSRELWENLYNTTHQLIRAQEKSEKIEINKTPELKEKLDQAKEKIKKINSDAMRPEIENLFARFLPSLKVIKNNPSDKESSKQIKFLYGCILDENFKRKIILDDANIKEIFKQVHQEEEDGEVKHVINLTPYLINRFLLQAILQKPEDWSPLFFEKIKEVLSLINKEQDQGLNAELKKYSYQDIMKQINYLIDLYQWKKDEAGDTKKPHHNKYDIKIILPENIKTLADFAYMIKYYPERLRETLLTTYKIKFEKIFERLFKDYSPHSSNSHPLRTIHTELEKNDEEKFLMRFFESFMLNLAFSNKSSLLASIPARFFLKKIKENDLEKFEEIKDAFIDSLFKTEAKMGDDFTTLLDFTCYYFTLCSDQNEKIKVIINKQQSEKIQTTLFRNPSLIKLVLKNHPYREEREIPTFINFWVFFLKKIKFTSFIDIYEFIEVISPMKPKIRLPLLNGVITEFKAITPGQLRKFFQLIHIPKSTSSFPSIKEGELDRQFDEANFVLHVQNNLSDMNAQTFIELIEKLCCNIIQSHDRMNFIKNNIKKINGASNKQLVKIMDFLSPINCKHSDNIGIIRFIAEKITCDIDFFSYERLISKTPREFRLEFIKHTIHKCKSINYKTLLFITQNLSSKISYYANESVRDFIIFIKELLEKELISFHAELFISLSNLITNDQPAHPKEEKQFVCYNPRLKFINENIELFINMPLCQDKRDVFFEHVIQSLWEKEKLLYSLPSGYSSPLKFIDSVLLLAIKSRIEYLQPTIELYERDRESKKEHYGISFFKSGVSKIMKLQAAKKIERFIGTLYTYKKESPQERILVLTKEEAQAISENKSKLRLICHDILNSLFGNSVFEKIEAFSQNREIKCDAVSEFVFSREKGGIEYTLTKIDQYNSLKNYNMVHQQFHMDPFYEYSSL